MLEYLDLSSFEAVFTHHQVHQWPLPRWNRPQSHAIAVYLDSQQRQRQVTYLIDESRRLWKGVQTLDGQVDYFERLDWERVEAVVASSQVGLVMVLLSNGNFECSSIFLGRGQRDHRLLFQRVKQVSLADGLCYLKGEDAHVLHCLTCFDGESEARHRNRPIEYRWVSEDTLEYIGPNSSLLKTHFLGSSLKHWLWRLRHY